MKTKFLLLLLSCYCFAFGQDFEMTFMSGDESINLDSVTACNLRTGETVSFAGSEKLVLAFGTGMFNLKSPELRSIVYPNPFCGRTNLDVTIPEPGDLEITVLNQLGQEICRELTPVEQGNQSFQLAIGTSGFYTVDIRHPEGRAHINVLATSDLNNPSTIDYLGQQSPISAPPEIKSGLDANTLSFILGDEIRYTFYGDIHSTIMQEEPRGSKAYKVVFPFCIDPDGKSYQTVTIGDQVWMAENLAYLPEVSATENLVLEEPRFYVFGSHVSTPAVAKTSEYYKKYGALYNWEAAMISCPEGWHLPGDGEWKVLEDEMGMSSLDQQYGGWRYSGDVGKKLKSCTDWLEGGCGINSCGLNLFPAGWLGDDGFEQMGMSFATFTSSHINTQSAYNRWVSYDQDGIYKAGVNRKYAASVRCVKD